MAKYQIFNPGKYLDWEKATIEGFFEKANKSTTTPRTGPENIIEHDMIRFNRNWDPYNPLFNNKEYAQKAGLPNIPAFPTYKKPKALYNDLSVTAETTEKWDVLRYFGHGHDDVEIFAPIYPGHSFFSENNKLMIEDITEPGADIRIFKYGSVSSLYNAKGDLVVRFTHYHRNGYRKIIDGTPRISLSAQLADWVEFLKPEHVTTEKEWDYIKQLWAKESIRGKAPLYWEDVKIGDEPPMTCSGPVSYMDMIKWHPESVENMQPKRDALKNAKTNYHDRYGNYIFGPALHYGGRSVPGARSVFFNHTATLHVLRLVTNWIGDAGFVSRVGWMFQQLEPEMQYKREGGEHLDKVPYMKGKACTIHPSEGDTVIGKGYVTDKYVNDKGEHIVDIVCWGETLEKDIIEVVPVSVKLPSKKK